MRKHEPRTVALDRHNKSQYHWSGAGVRSLASSRLRCAVSLIMLKIAFGDSGNEFTVTPKGDNASATALPIAAATPTVPASPATFRPSGLCGDGEFCKRSVSISAGISTELSASDSRQESLSGVGLRACRPALRGSHRQAPGRKPPINWPSTRSGLTATPISNEMRYFRIFIVPRAGSTSTKARCAP